MSGKFTLQPWFHGLMKSRGDREVKPPGGRDAPAVAGVGEIAVRESSSADR